MNNFNLDKLLESANPMETTQRKAEKLAKKWGRTGLLEKLDSHLNAGNMSMMLENQAKQLITELESDCLEKGFIDKQSALSAEASGVFLIVLEKPNA